MHRLLADSAEKIELNGNKGLGSESEEGAEAIDKLIRYLREHGSRKVSSEANFHDTFVHLWKRSLPAIVALNRDKAHKLLKSHLQSAIDSVVQSCFLSAFDEDQ